MGRAWRGSQEITGDDMDQKIKDALAKLSPEDQQRWLDELLLFGSAFIQENEDGTSTFNPASQVHVDWKI